MKNLCFVLTCFLALNLCAQTIERSENFNEKFNGGISIQQMANGNTFMIEPTGKEGLMVTLYDPERVFVKKEKLSLAMVPDQSNWTSGLKAVYEMNGDLVLFYVRTDEGMHKMIRIIVDGKTGLVKREDKIGETTEFSGVEQKFHIKNGLFKAPGGFIYEASFLANQFIIIKDPDSDYYALIKENSNADFSPTRVEILHFNGAHKQTKKTMFSKPDAGFTFYNCLAYYIRKDESVAITSIVYNTKKTGGEARKYYVSQTISGSEAFRHKEIALTVDDNTNVYFKMLHNQPKNMIHVFACKATEYKIGRYKYETSYQSVEPSTFNVSNPVLVDFTALNTYYKGKMARKEDFTGIINDVKVDKEGNLLFLFQNTEYYSSSASSMFGDIAYVKTTPEGKNLQSLAIPYNLLDRGRYSPFYSNGMCLIATDNASYLLLNNSQKNMALDETKKATEIAFKQHTNAVKYTIVPEGLTRDYAYQEPADEKDFKYLVYGNSDFNAGLRSYVALMNDPIANKMCLLWLKLE